MDQDPDFVSLGKGEDMTWITRGARGSLTLINMPSVNWRTTNHTGLYFIQETLIMYEERVIESIIVFLIW